MNNLQKILDDIATSFSVLKHHIKVLQKENKVLKEQIKHLYELVDKKN